MNINDVLSLMKDENAFNVGVDPYPINVGASGAMLYRVTGGNKKYVLKFMHRAFCEEDSQFEAQKNELLFYEAARQLDFIPNVSYSKQGEDFIILLLDFYEPISHERWSLPLQKQAVDLCAKINSLDLSLAAKLGLGFTPQKIDRAAAEQAYGQWQLVLKKHTGLDPSILDKIYGSLEKACQILNGQPHFFCHGDFHPENILTDGNRLLVCDWQGVNMGKGIGDFSFFISRGKGFGIKINEDELLDYYCEKLCEYKRADICKIQLLREKHAAVLLTTFMFWVSRERVSEQFESMVRSFKYLAVH